MAASHLLREPLDNGGLADTGLADKGEVVLGATGEDLQHALRLVLAPQNRVELPSRASWVMSCPCFASILSGSREPSPRSPFKAARRSVSVRPTPPPAARWPPCPHPRVEGPRRDAPCPPPAGRGFARLLAGELQGAWHGGVRCIGTSPSRAEVRERERSLRLTVSLVFHCARPRSSESSAKT